MRRGITVGELRWPTTPEFEAVARGMNQGAINMLTRAIWCGYDRFFAEVIAFIDPTRADAEVERSITQYMSPYINECIDEFSPFHLLHSVREFETRRAPPAQAPEYDTAFVLYANPRITWPLEAKVLRTDGAVAPYIADVRGEFLTCRYAPFSAGGAMIAYLFDGDPHVLFDNIERQLGTSLRQQEFTPSRQHRYSDHVRTPPPNKPYPAQFRCHHIVMQMSRRP